MKRFKLKSVFFALLRPALPRILAQKENAPRAIPGANEAWLGNLVSEIEPILDARRRSAKYGVRLRTENPLPKCCEFVSEVHRSFRHGLARIIPA